jgi:CBS domain-containing protein
MATVRDILQNKDREVWSVGPDAPLREALKLMTEKDIGAVLIIEAGEIIGIFSERDFARDMVSGKVYSLNTPIRQAMTHPVFYVTPDQTLDECMALMTGKRFRHLPVLENGKLAGLVSIGDIVKQIITEKEITIQDLEYYIWVHMI